MNSGTKQLADLINHVSEQLPEKILSLFSDDDHLKAAIICEYILID